MSHVPQQPNPYQTTNPMPYAMPQQNANQSDSTGGLIPYKNPHALIAYYLGLFSLFPILGLLLSIPAFILGIMGLRNRNRNPAIRGSVHAWIGIVMGGLMTLLWSGLLLLIIVAVIAEQR